MLEKRVRVEEGVERVVWACVVDIAQIGVVEVIGVWHVVWWGGRRRRRRRWWRISGPGTLGVGGRVHQLGWVEVGGWCGAAISRI